MGGPTLIGTLPAEMKLQILYKMPNDPLCRMRRTCSQMNSLIEENKKKLANRPCPGRGMRIVPCNNRIEFRGEDGIPRFYVEDDFYDKISAITFRSLTFDLKEGRGTMNMDQFSNFVEKLDLTCDVGTIICANEEYVHEILNGVTARTRLGIDHEGWHYAQFLIHLMEAPKREKISSVSIRILNFEVDGIFDLIKDYEEVHLSNISQSYFNKILEEILLWNEPFIAKKIVCDTLPEDNPGIEPPPMKALWDPSQIPPERPCWCAGLSQLDISNGKCAIVCENNTPTKEHMRNRIHFVSNDPSEIFNVVLKELYIPKVDDEVQQEYCRADEEQRKRLLVSTFMANSNRKKLRATAYY